MRVRKYVNEQGGLDKVVLTAQNADESDQLMEFVKEKEKRDAQGSGSEKYGASDWTSAGRAEDGFPVPKDSPEDVTASTGFFIAEAADGTSTLTFNSQVLGVFPTREDAEKAEAVARG